MPAEGSLRPHRFCRGAARLCPYIRLRKVAHRTPWLASIISRRCCHIFHGRHDLFGDTFQVGHDGIMWNSWWVRPETQLGKRNLFLQPLNASDDRLTVQHSIICKREALLHTSFAYRFPRDAQRAVPSAEVPSQARSMLSLGSDNGRDRALREHFLTPRPSSCTLPSLILA